MSVYVLLISSILRVSSLLYSSSPPLSSNTLQRKASFLEDLLVIPRDVFINEKLCGDLEAMECFEKYERVELESASTSYIRTKAKGKCQIVLLHGFDSSVFEFRRLLPQLETRQIPTYALDLLDSGFSTSRNKISKETKRKQIAEFIDFAAKETNAKHTILVGASLGGAAATDLAVNGDKLSTTLSLALVSPQITIDGTPELSPAFAKVGVKVLKSWPLRWIANQLAYADTRTYATRAAIAVGRIHTYRPDWEENALQWLLSGGYDSITSDFALLGATDSSTSRYSSQEEEEDKKQDLPPVYFFWGKDDKILPPYPDTIPEIKKMCPRANFTFYDKCGHVPHLEQPSAFAADLSDLVRGHML